MKVTVDLVVVGKLIFRIAQLIGAMVGVGAIFFYSVWLGEAWVYILWILWLTVLSEWIVNVTGIGGYAGDD